MRSAVNEKPAIAIPVGAQIAVAARIHDGKAQSNLPATKSSRSESNSHYTASMAASRGMYCYEIPVFGARTRQTSKLESLPPGNALARDATNLSGGTNRLKSKKRRMKAVLDLIP